MTLRYVGVDPDTGQGDSSTVWIDKERKRFVLQGYQADEDLIRQISEVPAPEHTAGIPVGEAAIWIPFRLAKIIREACDAAEYELE